jgi:hypothetical protein
MATTEYVLESLADIENHVRALSAADGSGEMIDAVTRYLESWSIDRIESLQKIDGGWGTFDDQQRPEPIHSLADISRISEALGNHCRALKEARLEPTPELLELDLYFVLARQTAEKFILGRLRSHSSPDSVPEDRRWTGNPRISGFYGNGIAGF